MGKLIEQKKSSRGQILQVVLLRHFPTLYKNDIFFPIHFLFNLKSESVLEMRRSTDCLKQ